MSESLAAEMHPFGVAVSPVNPGPVDTDFTKARGVPFQRSVPHPVSPERVAALVVRAVEDDRFEQTIPRWLRSGSIARAIAPNLYRRGLFRQSAKEGASLSIGWRNAGHEQGKKLAVAAGAVAAAAGVLAGRKVKGFYRELDFDTGHDEVLYAETTDGWRIALYRYAARGDRKPFPIVAGHGFAGTRLIWDLTPETSLARYLANAGYDFYAVDLRGRGESWPKIGSRADAQWSFDDFVERDLPAAVARACERSGAKEAFWLGLEMSGQALYASVISGTAGQVRGGSHFRLAGAHSADGDGPWCHHPTADATPRAGQVPCRGALCRADPGAHEVQATRVELPAPELRPDRTRPVPLQRDPGRGDRARRPVR